MERTMYHTWTYEELRAKPDSEVYHIFMQGSDRLRTKQENYRGYLVWKEKMEAKWSSDPRYKTMKKMKDREERDLNIFKARNNKVTRKC